MTKYIIVKVDSDTKMKTFLAGSHYMEFIWVTDHELANHYDSHNKALLDWNNAIRWCNPKGDRIFIPIYDPDQPPWA